CTPFSNGCCAAGGSSPSGDRRSTTVAHVSTDSPRRAGDNSARRWSGGATPSPAWTASSAPPRRRADVSWLDALRPRARDLVGAEDHTLREEIDYHLELETARQVAEGHDATAARERALERFGDPRSITEAARRERGGQPVESAMQDLKWAVRSLRKAPGF